MNYSKNNIQKKRKGIRSRKDRNLNSFFLICLQIVLLAFITVGVCAAGLGVGAVRGIIASTPTKYDLKPKYSATTIYDNGERTTQYLSSYDSNRILVSYDQMPDNLKYAFVAIEDERFFDHNGIDLKGIGRALIKNVLSGDISQGASTITQQLIKNNVFNVGGETNYIARFKRKIQEQYLAIHAEKENSKDTILKDYLNTINLGKGTLGVEAASRYYFGKSCSDLTLSECAVLAGITKNPAYLNPVDYPTDNGNRRLIILKKMLDLGFITSTDYQEAVADETVYQRIAEYRSGNRNVATYSYFTDALILQIVNDLQTRSGYTLEQAYEKVYRGGLSIYSTQDSKMQKAADEIINNPDNYPVDTKYALEYTLEVKKANGETASYNTSNLKKYFIKKKGKKNYKAIYTSKKKMKAAVEEYKKALLKEGDSVVTEKVHYSLQPQLSYTLIDQKTGQVKVLVGGRGEKQDDLSLNRATAVTRQPGSTFKILSTYAPGIDTGGMTLATVYDDAPYKYENGVSVHNAEKNYSGLMTIRDAIAESDNIIAVKALTELKPQVGFNFLKTLGFTTLVKNRTSEGRYESDVNQSLALGGITDGVTNLQLTAAYASIANKGEYTHPILYTKVLDNEGNVLLENKPKATRVMKESTAWLLTSAMTDVIKRGTGKEAKLASKMAVAGKTGTTSSNYDYWFCGYTPYYTASIWTGYDYNTDFGSGLDYHKEIWAKIMNRIIKESGQPIQTKFDPCKGIVTAKICMKSGKLPIPKLCAKDPQKNMKRTEYFAKGTVPTQSCDAHITVKFCGVTKKPVRAHCPKKKIYTKVYRKRPAGSKGITADTKYCLGYDANNDKNKCDKHTDEWFKKRQEKLEEKRKQEEAATATNADGTKATTAPATKPATQPAKKPASKKKP